MYVFTCVNIQTILWNVFCRPPQLGTNVWRMTRPVTSPLEGGPTSPVESIGKAELSKTLGCKMSRTVELSHRRWLGGGSLNIHWAMLRDNHSTRKGKALRHVERSGYQWIVKICCRIALSCWDFPSGEHLHLHPTDREPFASCTFA